MIVRKAGKRLIGYTVFNSDDTLMLNNLIGDMDLIKHDSEHTKNKLTNRFSNDIEHSIADKGRLN